MYMCVSVQYMHVHTYTCTVYECIHMHSMCMYTCGVSTCACVYMCGGLCICTHMWYVHVCMCACIYMYVYTYVGVCLCLCVPVPRPAETSGVLLYCSLLYSLNTGSLFEPRPGWFLSR